MAAPAALDALVVPGGQVEAVAIPGIHGAARRAVHVQRYNRKAKRLRKSKSPSARPAIRVHRSLAVPANKGNSNVRKETGTNPDQTTGIAATRVGSAPEVRLSNVTDGTVRDFRDNEAQGIGPLRRNGWRSRCKLIFCRKWKASRRSANR